jgi:hypothetical protein
VAREFRVIASEHLATDANSTASSAALSVAKMDLTLPHTVSGLARRAFRVPLTRSGLATAKRMLLRRSTLVGRSGLVGVALAQTGNRGFVAESGQKGIGEFGGVKWGFGQFGNCGLYFDCVHACGKCRGCAPLCQDHSG